MRLFVLVTSVAFSFAVASAGASQGHNHNKSKYAGQETREIKSLSEADIKELQSGAGWGLAKAAELNGVPGPAHLLELKTEVPLSEKQVEQIEALYKEMKAKAIVLGNRLIDQERALEAKFKDGSINDKSLRADLEAISQTRSELRFTHLETHLKTPDILTRAQITKYNQLRGYSAGDVCSQPVPKGHDPALFRRHNGCE